MPNSRELAIFAWLGVFLAVIIWRSDTRRPTVELVKALVGLAKSFIRPRLAGSLLLFLATVGVLCVAGAHAGIWDPGLTTKTVFWTFGAGIILFSEMKQAGDPVFFKNAAARVLGATALLVFYVNMSVFDLYIELLI